MRKRMAKFLSLFLTAVMVCSLLSVSALAALESHDSKPANFRFCMWILRLALDTAMALVGTNHIPASIVKATAAITIP